MGIVELHRVGTRIGLDHPAVDRALRQIAIVPLSESILQSAARLLPAGLRSLDAIHLATALDLAEAASVFVTYDRRQAVAAAGHGLEVLAPT